MMRKLLALLLILIAPQAFALNWGQLMYFHAGVAGRPYAVTIPDDGAGTAAAYTLTSPVFAEYRFTVADTHGADLTLGETNVVDGQYLCIYNVGSPALTLTASAGVLQMNTATFAIAQYQQFCATYQSDRWVEKSRGGTSIGASSVDLTADYAWTGNHSWTKSGSQPTTFWNINWSQTATADYINYPFILQQTFAPVADSVEFYGGYIQTSVADANIRDISHIENFITVMRAGGTSAADHSIVLNQSAGVYGSGVSDITTRMASIEPDLFWDSTGTCAWCVSIDAYVSNTSLTTGTMTWAGNYRGLIAAKANNITNAAVFYARTPTRTTGTISDAYGLYIEDQLVTGVTDANAIYVAGDAPIETEAGIYTSTVNAVTGADALIKNDCGRLTTVTAGIDGSTITLPEASTVLGCTYTISYIGADGGALVDISPLDSDADGIEGGCTLAASVVTFSGTADADIGLTKATSLTGDYIRLTAATSAMWVVTGCQGIWANN